MLAIFIGILANSKNIDYLQIEHLSQFLLTLSHNLKELNKVFNSDLYTIKKYDIFAMFK